MSLSGSKSIIDDECYTQEKDIHSEVFKYVKELKGKNIYLNCDDANWSNFWWYFYSFANRLGIASVTATCFNAEGHGEYWRYSTDNPYSNERIVEEIRRRAEEKEEKKTDVVTCKMFDNVEHKILNGNGSFDSEECIEILKQSDIVITNPPFSLFRNFISLLTDNEKKFLIIGNMNAVVNKDMFPYIKNGIIRLGYTNPTDYIQPDGSIKNVPGRWYTNLPTEAAATRTQYYSKYDKNMYARYADYDAIDCKKGANIPCDYTGIIGVPSTYIKDINIDQFEILDHHEPAIELEEYKRFYTPHKSRQKKVNGVLCNKTFHRIFIRWKPEAMPKILPNGIVEYDY